MKTGTGLSNLRKKFRFIHELTNTNVAIERRITMIIALAGAIGNTLGFLANFFLYGMNIPTACCAVCALLLLLNAMFGLNSTHCRALGWAEIILLDVFEFPLLVLTYGAVMYPYLMLGFVALLMLATGRRRLPLCVLLALYDLAVIVYSSLHPYLFGPQDPMGLMGSAIATFTIALCAMSACIIAWQGVSVLDSSELDSTTGLLTRAGFLRSAGELLTEERASDYAILYFNIMNFKVVNSLCHLEGGNRLLKKYGQILKTSPLQPILTCRMNADRFVCLISKDRLNFQQLNDLCELQFDDNGKSIPLTIHCGIFFPEEGDTDISSMIDKAHLSERSVRSVQEQHYVLYDRGYSAIYQQETELLAELDTALREQVFVPYYQPVVDCKTGKIVSAEALARWIHPQRGVLAPGAFIPILERKELISELDSVILDKVNAFLAAQEQIGAPVVPVSVNLSRIDLFNNRLMEQIRAQLMEQRGSSRIKARFELTESAYESLPESTLNLLAELRSAGAKILLDDFGTGYSSLGMITDCEFDIIKLDKSFADRLESSEKVRGIVLSLIEMVHKLNATVIMEGVETSAQLEYLTSAGCDQVQGYLFYRPMPEAEFAELLRRQASTVSEIHSR